MDLAVRGRRRRVLLAASAAAAVLLLGNRGFRSLVRQSIELHRLRREMRRLKAEEGELRRRAKSSESDADLRRSARKLGYLMPGEVEYRFPPPGKK
jgi:cell division protein FtsB